MIPALLLAAALTGNTSGAPAVTTSNPCPNRGAPGNIRPWTAPCTGTATATMCGFDTVVEIRRAGVPIACDDDSAGGLCERAYGSRVTWPIVAGDAYSVVATGYLGSSSGAWAGPYALAFDVSCAPPDPDPAAPDCPFPPSFDIAGTKACTPARQLLPCVCSEAIVWDVTPGADYYDVFRDGLYVGDTLAHEQIRGIGLDANGNPMYGPARITYWMPLNDSRPPEAGKVYRYQVRACADAWTPKCGTLSGSVAYAGVPTAFYRDGKEYAGYVGDKIEAVSP